jgi:hypothetical protein
MALRPFAPVRRLYVDVLFIQSIDPFGSIFVTGEHERVDDSIIVKTQTSRSLSDGAIDTGNHSAGNECMTYPPIKVGFDFENIRRLYFCAISRAREALRADLEIGNGVPLPVPTRLRCIAWMAVNTCE